MNEVTIKILVPLDKNCEFDDHLKEVYPYIYTCLPTGFENIIDCLMTAFMLEKHDVSVYLEECTNVLDYLITTDDEENIFKQPNNISQYGAVTELYSYEFYDYLLQVYKYFENVILSILKTNNFTVTDYTTLHRVNKLLIEVNIQNAKDTIGCI